MSLKPVLRLRVCVDDLNTRFFICFIVKQKKIKSGKKTEIAEKIKNKNKCFLFKFSFAFFLCFCILPNSRY